MSSFRKSSSLVSRSLTFISLVQPQPHHRCTVVQRKLSSLVSRSLTFVHVFVLFQDFVVKFGSPFLDFFVPATTTSSLYRGSKSFSRFRIVVLIFASPLHNCWLDIQTAIMALASTLAFASDSNPLQDICITVNDSKSTTSVNGKVCKDPKLAKASDFFFSGLLTPRKTSNPVGLMVTAINVMQIPGLNTLGIFLPQIDFAPYGLNPSHTHPHATEILVVFKGSPYVSFVR
ncbi:hypothetical protein ACSBR1_040593 [Camellia fascicularis]